VSQKFNKHKNKLSKKSIFNLPKKKFNHNKILRFNKKMKAKYNNKIMTRCFKVNNI